jgi:hypothetical protein
LTLIFVSTNCIKLFRKELPRIVASESSCPEIGSHVPTNLMLVHVRQGGGKGHQGRKEGGGRGVEEGVRGGVRLGGFALAKLSVAPKQELSSIWQLHQHCRLGARLGVRSGALGEWF